MRGLSVVLSALAGLALSVPSCAAPQDAETVYVLEVDMERLAGEGAESTDHASVLRSALSVIEQRISVRDEGRPEVAIEGDRFITIAAPPAISREDIERVLGVGPVVEFRFHRVEPQELEEWDDAVARSLETAEIITADHLTDARASLDPLTGQAVVEIQFDGAGGEQLARLTKAYLNASLSVLIDGEILSTATIHEPILQGRMMLSGGQGSDDAEDIASRLRAGALPVPLAIVEVRSPD